MDVLVVWSGLGPGSMYVPFLSDEGVCLSCLVGG